MTKTNRLIRDIGLTSLMLLSTGCSTAVSTAPEKTYYVLRAADTKPLAISGKANVSIRSVKLPSYLNQFGIVRQLPNGQVNVSYTDLWAEKLSQAIPALLSDELSQQLGTPVEIHPLPPGIQVKTVIEVNISHLIATQSVLRLQSNYRIIKNGNMSSYSYYTVVKLTDNATNTLVVAYAKAIEQLSVHISNNL